MSAPRFLVVPGGRFCPYIVNALEKDLPKFFPGPPDENPQFAGFQVF